MLEYAFGTSPSIPNGAPWTLTRDDFGRLILTFPRALPADDAALTIESAATLGEPWVPAAATLVSSTPNGAVATESWRITPPSGSNAFFLRLRATLR